MSVTIITKLVILGVFVGSINCNRGEYFWRPWATGSPPPDAVTARDYRGISYIVEVYVPNYGLHIGQAFANQHQVNVSVSNSTKTSVFVIQTSQSLKVLCTGDLDKLAWYPTNYYTLANDLVTAAVQPVLGGINSNDQVVYIGRYVDTSKRTVVLGSLVKDNLLHYHYDGKPYIQYYYEILVISTKCTSEA